MTAYELTWLDPHGKPQIAIATLVVPVTSVAIVESKSVKLYLGAFAQTRFDGSAEVAATIEHDLARPQAELRRLRWRAGRLPVHATRGSCRRKPGRFTGGDPALPPDTGVVGCGRSRSRRRSLPHSSGRSARLHSSPTRVGAAHRGPRSIAADCCATSCPTGAIRIPRHCVERIFVDVMARCRCETLSVYARLRAAAASTRFAQRRTCRADVRTPRQ